MKKGLQFNFEVVAAWVVATATAALTMAAYAFNTFETKDHAKEFKGDVSTQLTRIEDKLDRVDDKLSRAFRPVSSR